jgi:hypothetical protein
MNEENEAALEAMTPPFFTALRDWALRGASLMGIWYAVLLHATWVVMLLLDSRSTAATAVHGPAELFPNHYGLALLLVTVAGCATGAIFMRLSRLKIALLVPQQIMLGISAAAAVQAMAAKHFADGVARPRGFIIADQVPAVIALVVHSLTIVYLAFLFSEKNGGSK